MTKEFVVVKGVFSEIKITLNDDVMNRLAITETQNNSLAKIEGKLRKLSNEFEKAYFKAATPTKTEGNKDE